MSAKRIDDPAAASGPQENNDFVTMTISGQLFGIPVLGVQDVLGPQAITRIPLAPPEVAGTLNLRGRIVTAIDVRTRLRLPERDADGKAMRIVFDHAGELYSLMIDSVGEVLKLPADRFDSASAFARALADPNFRHHDGASGGGAARGARGVAGAGGRARRAPAARQPGRAGRTRAAGSSKGLPVLPGTRRALLLPTAQTRTGAGGYT